MMVVGDDLKGVIRVASDVRLWLELLYIFAMVYVGWNVGSWLGGNA